MPSLSLRKTKLFIPSKHQECAAISITADTVQIVTARLMPYHKEIVSTGSISVAGKSDAEIIEALRSLVVETGVRRTGAVLVIPSQAVITKNIEIPSRDPQEIREIVNLQAGRHTPYSREEIIVDYLDLGAFKQNYSKILLVIASKSVVKHQIEMLERAGIIPDRAVAAPEAVGWSLSKILHVETGDVPAVVVHVDELTSDFVVVLRGKSIFVRSIPLGSRQLHADKERNDPKFAAEIKRSIEAFQSEDIERKPSTLVITGSLERTESLEKLLTNEVALSVKFIAYTKQFNLSAAIQKQVSADKNISFLPMASALLAGGELTVDIAPEEIKLRKSLEERGRELIKAGIFIMAIFILSCLVFAVNIFAKGAYLKKIENRYAALAAQVQELETDFSKIGLIRSYFTFQGYSLEVMTDLAKIAPDNMQFSDIRFDNEVGKIAIRGTAESMASVFSFSENLDKSKFFKEVQVKNTSKRKDGERDVTDFELACQLERNSQR
jgi:Tfp pilus assembly PilM family ATPase